MTPRPPDGSDGVPIPDPPPRVPPREAAAGAGFAAVGTRVIGRLLCWVGIHRWLYFDGFRRCYWCFVRKDGV